MLQKHVINKPSICRLIGNSLRVPLYQTDTKKVILEGFVFNTNASKSIFLLSGGEQTKYETLANAHC